MRKFSIAATALVAVVFLASTCQAGFVFTLKEVAGKIEITRTGSFNTAGFASGGSATLVASPFIHQKSIMAGTPNGSASIVRFLYSSVTRSVDGGGAVTLSSADSVFPLLPSTPSTPFGGSNPVGTIAGFSLGTTSVFFSPQMNSGGVYSSGTVVSTSINNLTFGNLGWTAPRTEVYTFTGATGGSETITINAVPEPSSLAVVGGLVAGLSVLSRRRRQA